MFDAASLGVAHLELQDALAQRLALLFRLVQRVAEGFALRRAIRVERRRVAEARRQLAFPGLERVDARLAIAVPGLERVDARLAIAVPGLERVDARLAIAVPGLERVDARLAVARRRVVAVLLPSRCESGRGAIFTRVDGDGPIAPASSGALERSAAPMTSPWEEDGSRRASPTAGAYLPRLELCWSLNFRGSWVTAN